MTQVTWDSAEVPAFIQAVDVLLDHGVDEVTGTRTAFPEGFAVSSGALFAPGHTGLHSPDGNWQAAHPDERSERGFPVPRTIC